MAINKERDFLLGQYATHVDDSSLWPRHTGTLFNGVGFEQLRVRLCTPTEEGPHGPLSGKQTLHSDHTDHEPVKSKKIQAISWVTDHLTMKFKLF